MSNEVVIIRTGVANLSSVMAGFERTGTTPRLTESAADVRDAARVMLPGVGAFKAAMDRLNELGLVDVLIERIGKDRPTMTICLGMQLLGESSEEDSGVRGLGIVPNAITRFRGNVRIPQLGWNKVEANDNARFLRIGHAYFANSYKIDEAPPGWNCAFTEHGQRFVAAMERGNVLACQFHPELSGQWGLELLKRWLKG